MNHKTKRMRSVKMKSVKAWAITDPEGNLIEIARIRKVGERRAFILAPSILVPVLITEIVAGKGRKK